MFLYFFQDLLIAHLLGGIQLDLEVFELWGFLQVMLEFFLDGSRPDDHYFLGVDQQVLDFLEVFDAIGLFGVVAGIFAGVSVLDLGFHRAAQEKLKGILRIMVFNDDGFLFVHPDPG